MFCKAPGGAGGGGSNVVKCEGMAYTMECARSAACCTLLRLSLRLEQKGHLERLVEGFHMDFNVQSSTICTGSGPPRTFCKNNEVAGQEGGAQTQIHTYIYTCT